MKKKGRKIILNKKKEEENFRMRNKNTRNQKKNPK